MSVTHTTSLIINNHDLLPDNKGTEYSYSGGNLTCISYQQGKLVSYSFRRKEQDTSIIISSIIVLHLSIVFHIDSISEYRH